MQTYLYESYFKCFKPKQVFLKLDELPYPALRLLFTILSDEDLASITSTCLRLKQIADPIWKKRGDLGAMSDYLWRKIWSNCDHEFYSDRFERTKIKTSRILLKSTPFEQIQTPIKTNPASHRSVMKLTRNYILTRDDTSETGLIVHKRYTYEYVGVIGAPFEGEWGWDYEIEVMHDYNVVITRACLPPHVIRFFKLDQVTDDEPCLPYKELIIEAEPFWA